MIDTERRKTARIPMRRLEEGSPYSFRLDWSGPASLGLSGYTRALWKLAVETRKVNNCR